MNLNMIQLKNKTEDPKFLNTENFETLIKQTHTKPQAKSELKIT